MEQVLKKKLKKIKSVKWTRDPDAPNPRKDKDLFTHMIFKDLSLTIGDVTEINTEQEWYKIYDEIQKTKSVIEIKPVYVRDNPQKEIVLSFENLTPAYDVRMIGYMYMTKDQYLNIGMTTEEKDLEVIDTIFNFELKYYLNYLSGTLINLECEHMDGEKFNVHIAPEDIDRYIDTMIWM